MIIKIINSHFAIVAAAPARNPNPRIAASKATAKKIIDQKSNDAINY